MEKLKIISISSETYPGGRIDSFTVPLFDRFHQGINHSHIMPLFEKLGFAKDSVDDLDIDFENKPAGTYFFSYGNKKIKFFIVIGEKTISINLDTSLPREQINKVIDKYFEFPK